LPYAQRGRDPRRWVTGQLELQCRRHMLVSVLFAHCMLVPVQAALSLKRRFRFPLIKIRERRKYQICSSGKVTITFPGPHQKAAICVTCLKRSRARVLRLSRRLRICALLDSDCRLRRALPIMVESRFGVVEEEGPRCLNSGAGTALRLGSTVCAAAARSGDAAIHYRDRKAFRISCLTRYTDEPRRGIATSLVPAPDTK
jgi:hypothetical protein